MTSEPVRRSPPPLPTGYLAEAVTAVGVEALGLPMTPRSKDATGDLLVHLAPDVLIEVRGTTEDRGRLKVPGARASLARHRRVAGELGCELIVVGVHLRERVARVEDAVVVGVGAVTADRWDDLVAEGRRKTRPGAICHYPVAVRDFGLVDQFIPGLTVALHQMYGHGLEEAVAEVARAEAAAARIIGTGKQ